MPLTGPAIPPANLGFGFGDGTLPTPGAVQVPPQTPVAVAPPVAPTSADLLAAFPEFSNVPPARLQLQLALALSSVRPQFWQDRWPMAVLLYAAHYVALGAPTYVTAAGTQPGANSGIATGVASSKSVGGVSVGYNTALGGVPDSGSFDATLYGRQYMTMLQSSSAALQL